MIFYEDAFENKKYVFPELFPLFKGRRALPLFEGPGRAHILYSTYIDIYIYIYNLYIYIYIYMGWSLSPTSSFLTLMIIKCS